eukprot:1070453-Amphidinium_carterae.1
MRCWGSIMFSSGNCHEVQQVAIVCAKQVNHSRLLVMLCVVRFYCKHVAQNRCRAHLENGDLESVAQPL